VTLKELKEKKSFSIDRTANCLIPFRDFSVAPRWFNSSNHKEQFLWGICESGGYIYFRMSLRNLEALPGQACCSSGYELSINEMEKKTKTRSIFSKPVSAFL